MATPVTEGTPPPPVSPSGVQQHQEDPGGTDPLLTGHAALVFLGATLIGIVFGGLAYISTGNTAAAIICGLSTAGIALDRLHKLIGR